jgi:hypothetical protein
MWDIYRIVKELTSVWDEFKNRLAPARRQWFTQGIIEAGQYYSPPVNLCAKTQPTGKVP